MLPNCITLARFPLLLVIVLGLYLGSPPVRLAGAALLLVGLMLDSVDGAVARRMGRTSLAGSVHDIAADRTYELVLWVCFAHLGLVPVAVPLLIIARTALTDAFRGVGVAAGAAPFEQERSPLGRFLVGSAWMRTAYSGMKVVTFCGLAVVQAGGWESVRVAALFQVTAWLAVALCLLRGAPVVARLTGALTRGAAGGHLPACRGAGPA